MAFTDNTTYTGKDALGFYSAALLTGDTKSILTVIPNVKSSIKMGRVDMDGLLQAADCTFTDGGNTVLSQKSLSVCPIKVNKVFCQRTFEANYLGEQLKAGSNSDASIIPASFQEYILKLMAENVSKGLENILWNGNTGSTAADISLCNGFIKKFAADASVVGLTAASIGATSQLGMTAGNVIACLTAAYNAIPAQVLGSPDLRMFVSTSTMKLYSIAQAAQANGAGLYFLNQKEMTFLGIPIVVSKQFPAQSVVVADTKNLWVGTDLVSDFEDVMLLPQKSVTGAPNINFVAEFKFGVEYGVSEEIVYAKFN